MPLASCSSVAQIAALLAQYQASLIAVNTQKQAAVALVLRDRGGQPEVLFIARASSPKDPWSGQIALPGGRLEPVDASLVATAIRETREETGLPLALNQLIGRLDDSQSSNNNRNLNLVVGCFVFGLHNDIEIALSPNYEVAEIFWIPLSLLANADNGFAYQTRYRQQPYPAIDLGLGNAGQERVLWGLTYRLIKRFFKIIGARI